MAVINRGKGQISIFLIIIVLSMIALAGLLVDGARIISGEQQVKRAAGFAAKAVLADYNSKLKDEYGLFAFGRGTGQMPEDVVKKYLEKNLTEVVPEKSEKKYFDLFGFRVEDVKVTPMFPLSENEVVEKQILEYMKYRGPKALAEGIWDRLAALRESGKMAEAFQKKMEADKLAGRMEKLQKELKQHLDGTGPDDDSCVNGFNKSGKRDQKAEQLVFAHGEYVCLQEELREVEARLAAPEDTKRNKSERKQLREQQEELLSRMDSASRQMEKLWQELYKNETENYIKPNTRSAEIIQNIMELGKEAGEAIRKLEDDMGKNLQGEGETVKIFGDTMNADIQELKRLIMDDGRAGRMLSKVEQNKLLLANSLQGLESLRSSLFTGTLQEAQIRQAVRNGLEAYDNQLSNDYSGIGGSGKASDPRKGLAENVKNALSGRQRGWKGLAGRRHYSGRAPIKSKNSR